MDGGLAGRSFPRSTHPCLFTNTRGRKGSGREGVRVESKIAMAMHLTGWESEPISLINIIQYNIYFKYTLTLKHHPKVFLQEKTTKI